MKSIYYIKYLNKDDNFREARKDFDSLEAAQEWAKSNLEKFNPDMIKTEDVEILINPHYNMVEF